MAALTGKSHSVKVKFTHTIQLRQYEPVTFEVEFTQDGEGDIEATYDNLVKLAEKKFMEKFEELEELRK